jgi:hypothetical protein
MPEPNNVGLRGLFIGICVLFIVVATWKQLHVPKPEPRPAQSTQRPISTGETSQPQLSLTDRERPKVRPAVPGTQAAPVEPIATDNPGGALRSANLPTLAQQEREPDPIQPASPQSTTFPVTLRGCNRIGEAIRCSGWIINLTDEAMYFGFTRSNLTDDQGNAFSNTKVAFTNGFIRYKIAPNIKTAFTVIQRDPHTSVKSITLEINTGRNLDESSPESFIFKDIPLR